ncbi:MAG: M15 family metallopeptidase [Acidimicrobiales bacterium]
MTTRQRRTLLALALTVVPVAAAACGGSPQAVDGGGDTVTQATTQATTPATGSAAITVGPPPTTTPPPEGVTDPPDWLGSRVLPTDANGVVPPQTTPPELVDRRFATEDTIPSPGPSFVSTIKPLDGEPLERSTWSAACPVGVDELRYVTVSFWGFDDRPHTGELIVRADVADDVAGVFRQLFDERFPIEQMRIITEADLESEPTGDGNNSGSFVCRPVTGGTSYSEHAYGLAVDINPFQNPYVKGDRVLPELATAYTDRARVRPGMIGPDSAPTRAFAAMGWSWGGNWDTLKDYQHFSLNDR